MSFYRVRFWLLQRLIFGRHDKYHDSVIDRNLNLTRKAGADIAQLQTLHDFVRWKQEGRVRLSSLHPSCPNKYPDALTQLLAYKPAGFEHIPDNIKDVDGFYL